MLPLLEHALNFVVRKGGDRKIAADQAEHRPFLTKREVDRVILIEAEAGLLGQHDDRGPIARHRIRRRAGQLMPTNIRECLDFAVGGDGDVETVANRAGLRTEDGDRNQSRRCSRRTGRRRHAGRRSESLRP